MFLKGRKKKKGKYERGIETREKERGKKIVQKDKRRKGKREEEKKKMKSKRETLCFNIMKISNLDLKIVSRNLK